MKTIIKKIKRLAFFSLVLFIASVGVWKSINSPLTAATVSAAETQHTLEVNELYTLASQVNKYVEKAHKRAIDFLDTRNNTPYRVFLDELSQDISDINVIAQRFREMSSRQNRSDEYHKMCGLAHQIVHTLNGTLRKLNSVLRENQNSWTTTLGTSLQKLEKEMKAIAPDLKVKVTQLGALACKFDHRLGAIITTMQLQLVKMNQVNDGKSVAELLKALRHRHNAK